MATKVIGKKFTVDSEPRLCGINDLPTVSTTYAPCQLVRGAEMEITEKNVERVLRGYGLGMDAGLNEHWLRYGFEPSQEQKETTMDEAFLLKPANIRASTEEPQTFTDDLPCRTLNVHDMSDKDLRAAVARLYGNLSYQSYVRFCEQNQYSRMPFDQWTLLEKELTVTAPNSSKPAIRKDKRETTSV